MNKTTLPSYCILLCLAMGFQSCKKEESSGGANLSQGVSDESAEFLYGGSENEIGNAILAHGNFLYSYGTKENGVNNKSAYLIKTDLNGQLVWEKTLSSSTSQEGLNLILSNDGNLLCLGSILRNSNSDMDVQLYKVDLDGNILWEKTHGFSASNESATGIAQSASTGFITITGLSTNTSGGDNDLYLLYLDSNGNELSQGGFGGPANDGGTEVLLLADGRSFLFGFTYSFGNADRNFYLIKFDEFGNKLWEKTYGGNGYEQSEAIALAPDGNLILCGHSSSVDPEHQMFGMKVDLDGNVVWEKHWGGSLHDGGQALLVDSRGRNVFVARSMSFKNNQNAYVVQTDQSGNALNELVLGSPENNWCNDITEHMGYYYLTGESSVEGKSDKDLSIIKHRMD